MASAGLEHFFLPGRLYAVAGASSDPTRFGYKVLKWYVSRNLPVTPVNPKPAPILDLQTVPNLTELAKNISAQSVDGTPSAAGLGLSVITPPHVSVQLMKEASTLNGLVKAVWFQPGAYNNEVLQAAQDAGIDHIIAYDDCILVQGDTYLEHSAKL